VVVWYGWGLGQTKPLAKTGEAASAASPLALPIDVQFQFSPNAGPSKPYAGEFPFVFEFQPRFAGLVTGQAGLYQVNVKLPDSFPSVQACDASRDRFDSIRAT
jgi:uncharacterized protein (TIGR03437 family)